MTGKKETDVTKIFEGIEVSTDNAVENLRFIQKVKSWQKRMIGYTIVQLCCIEKYCSQ